MFARHNIKTVLQCLGLVSALAFTLSTLPGFQDASETTNASEVANSDCADIVSNSDSGSCTLNGSGELSNVTATVTARKLEEGIRERDEKDAERFKVSPGFEVELRTSCKVMDGDCQEKTTVLKVPLKDHRQIAAKALEQFRKDGKVVADAKSAAEQRRKDEFDCKIDGVGKKVENMPACRIAQMKRLKDEGKEAAYFEANVLPEIKRLLSQTDPASQQKGMNLLKAYAAAGLGNDYITQTIETHRQFGFFNRQAIQSKRELTAAMQANPFSQEVQMARQMALMHSRTAENYFYQRGLEVPSTWGDVGGYDLGGYMQNNLSSMRQIVSDHYAMTLNQYQNGVNQNLMNNLTGNGAGANTMRNANGTQPAVNTQQQQLMAQQHLQQNQLQAPQMWNGLPVPPAGGSQRTMQPQSNLQPQSTVRNINPRTSTGSMRSQLR